jgi:hypothetical protein
MKIFQGRSLGMRKDPRKFPSQSHEENREKPARQFGFPDFFMPAPAR